MLGQANPVHGPDTDERQYRPPSTPRFDLVVAAASHGGLKAYLELLGALPSFFPAAIVLVQHRPAHHTDLLPRVLARNCRLQLEPVEHGVRPVGGTVYVAPPTGTVRIAQDGTLAADLDPRRAVRPADTLFQSAALAHGPRLIAVVLSGRLDDGARGVRTVKRRGGRVLIQDEASSTAFGMPSASICTGSADFLLAPRAIASALVTLVMVPGAADFFKVPAASWATPLELPGCSVSQDQQEAGSSASDND